MSENKNVNFAVFENSYKKQDNHPDRRGNIEVTEALLKEMVDIRKSGELPILEVALWNRTSKKGVDYLYGSLGINQYEMKKRRNEQGAPGSGGSDPFDDPLPESKSDDDDPFA